MKKVWITLFMAVCIAFSCAIGVCAEEAYVVDNADLLSRQEVSRLEDQLEDIIDEYDMDVVVVTVDSLDGEEAQDYADDFCDYNDYSRDCVLLLVSIEDGQWYISTAGECIDVFTDAGIKYIGKKIKPHFSDEAFMEGFETFAQLCDEFMAQAQTGDPYDSHNLPKLPFRTGLNLIIAVVIGLAVAAIAIGIMKGQLKSVRTQSKADDYVKQGSLNLTQSRDLFLYTHLDRRAKPKSSGGSSTHVSSSGTTHGGGGGRF